MLFESIDDKRWLPAFGLVVATLATAPTASAQAIAKEVVALRQDVDKLAADLRTQREAARTELVALVSEKRELERQLRLEQVRQKTLKALEQERAASAAHVDEALQEWAASIRIAIGLAEEMVRTTSPVHQRERLAQLQTVRAELDRAAPDPVVALEKLWRFLEEEEALSREVALDRQVFVEGGQEQLYDVVHLGLAVMYARSTTNEMFYVESAKDGAPALRKVSDERAQALIEELFDAVGRGKREVKVLLDRSALSPTAPTASSSESGAP